MLTQMITTSARLQHAMRQSPRKQRNRRMSLRIARRHFAVAMIFVAEHLALWVFGNQLVPVAVFPAHALAVADMRGGHRFVQVLP